MNFVNIGCAKLCIIVLEEALSANLSFQFIILTLLKNIRNKGIYSHSFKGQSAITTGSVSVIKANIF